MKIEQCDDFKTIVYVKNSFVDFEDKELIEEYFIDLFSKLRQYYNMEIKGYYNIKIYVDTYYGSVFEIIKEEIEYFEYSDTVDMRASIPIKSDFLYKTEDFYWINKELKNKITLYKDKENLYISLNELVNNNVFALILENTNLIYKNINKNKLIKMY